MTLHVYEELEQGTEEWMGARRGIVTASVVGKLITIGSPDAITVDCPACGETCWRAVPEHGGEEGPERDQDNP